MAGSVISATRQDFPRCTAHGLPQGKDASDGRAGNAEQEQEGGQWPQQEDEVAHYTEAADQERSAERAITRWPSGKCLT